VGEGLSPVSVAANARRLEPRGVEGAEHLVLVHITHRLDAFEARRPDGLEFFEHAPLVADGGVHDRLLDLSLLLASDPESGSWKKSGAGQACTRSGNELAAIDAVFHDAISDSKDGVG